MILKELHLKNFRNYDDCKVQFCDGLNLFLGPNGFGKSNILESIFLVCVGKDPWGAEMKELVKFDSANSILIADFEKRNRIELKINKSGSKEIIFNEKRLHKLSSLVGLFPTSIAGPQEVELVKGSPKVRRRLLDLHISQLSREYLESLSRYGKYLKGRNSILKTLANGITPAGGELYIESWDEKLADEGAKIIQNRIDFISKINPIITQYYKILSEENISLELKYECTIPISDKKNIMDNFISLLKKNRDREIRFGETITGPHRDDFSIILGNRDLKIYGSWGECRSASLSIMLSISKVLGERYDTHPIIILDDCFANLDEKRTRNLLLILKHFDQIFASSPLDFSYLNEASERIFRLTHPGRIEIEK